MTYEKAAADPRVPVITKDDYIEWLEEQIATARKALAREVKKLASIFGEMP